MIAAGVNPLLKGMSFGAQQLLAYDFNDDASEMMAAAAGGLLVSNHSYADIAGWYFDDTQQHWEFWVIRGIRSTSDSVSTTKMPVTGTHRISGSGLPDRKGRGQQSRRHRRRRRCDLLPDECPGHLCQMPESPCRHQQQHRIYYHRHLWQLKKYPHPWRRQPDPGRIP